MSEIAPRQQIRRFDVFTEWNRLKAREKMQLAEKDARVYGLAVAKVVAGRGGGWFGRKASTPHSKEHLQDAKKKARAENHEDEWWRDFGSDEEFDDKIIHRGTLWVGRKFLQAHFRARDSGSVRQRRGVLQCARRFARAVERKFKSQKSKMKAK